MGFLYVGNLSAYGNRTLLSDTKLLVLLQDEVEVISR